MELPCKKLRHLELLSTTTELITSSATRSRTATMELPSGSALSCIGIAAISERSMVITSSVGCNSPSCLLPMMRIHMIISTYKISARTNVTSIFITDNMIDENPQNKQNTEHHVFSVSTIFLISSGMGASRVVLSPVTGWTKLTLAQCSS